MYGVYVLHGYSLPKDVIIDFCATTAAYFPKRKKLKGYQKSRK